MGQDRQGLTLREYPSVLYVPDRAERAIIPGLRNLGMLNSLTTRGARHSTCQLSAHLELTARGPRTWDHRCGASRSLLAFTRRVPQAVPPRESLIADKRHGFAIRLNARCYSRDALYKIHIFHESSLYIYVVMCSVMSHIYYTYTFNCM